MTEPTSPQSTDSKPAEPTARESGLLKSSSIVSVLTLLSRVLGLVRESEIFKQGYVR